LGPTETINIAAPSGARAGRYFIAITGTDTNGQDPGNGAQIVGVAVGSTPVVVRNPLVTVGAITLVVGSLIAGLVILTLRRKKRSLP
jgi:hypothetical protein